MKLLQEELIQTQFRTTNYLCEDVTDYNNKFVRRQSRQYFFSHTHVSVTSTKL